MRRSPHDVTYAIDMPRTRATISRSAWRRLIRNSRCDLKRRMTIMRNGFPEQHRDLSAAKMCATYHFLCSAASLLPA